MEKISIICPFYNEQSIIENAVHDLIKLLNSIKYDYELILVNDGSTDDSVFEIEEIISSNKNVKLVTYSQNQGRGFALQSGIAKSIGDIIITTEIDLSWGSSVILDILNKFKSEPNAEVVIASPNLKGGGYKNVPLRRIFISKLGNKIIRALFTKKVTMNTGMTRGYKKEVIKNMKFDEKGKEFHLEALLKLFSIGAHIVEVPAILEWKDEKLSKPGLAKRKSSSKTKKLIFSHLNFAVFANPIRYFWFFSMICFCAGSVLLYFGFVNYLFGGVSVFYFLLSLMLFLFCILFFGFGILSSQNNKILKEIWKN